MAFQPLFFSTDTPPYVRAFISDHLTMQLHDVYCMLRLPLPAHGLDAGCNFAATAVLLNIVSGLSTIFYSQTGNSGDRFKNMIEAFYPWDFQRPTGHNNHRILGKKEGPEALYDYFRNPLSHALALLSEELRKKGQPTRIVLSKPALPVGIAKGSMTEAELDDLHRAGMYQPTLIEVDGHLLLSVASLYWGVRWLIVALTQDKARMEASDKFLRDGGLQEP